MPNPSQPPQCHSTPRGSFAYSSSASARQVSPAQTPATQPAPIIGQQILERETTGLPGEAPLWICARGAKPVRDEIEVVGPCIIRSDARGFMLVGELGLKIHVRDQETITVDGQFTSTAGAGVEGTLPLMCATHASFLFHAVIPRLVTPADIAGVPQEVDDARLKDPDPQALMNYLHRETLRGNLLPMVRYMSSGEEFKATPPQQTRQQFARQLRLSPDQMKDLSTDELFVRVLRNTFWFEWTRVLKVTVTKDAEDHAKAERIRLDGSSSSEMRRVEGRWIPG